MERLGYYNGDFGPLEEMKVPFLDRVSFYGDGVYDATMGIDGVVLFAEDHLDRFFNSCANVEIDPGISKAELHAVLTDMLAKVDAPVNFVYWQVTRGTYYRHHYFCDGPANLWIMIVPDVMEALYDRQDLISVEDLRFQMCNTKTLNLLPNVLAAQRTKEADCYEAVFVRDGYVTECAHSNVQMLKDGCFITHPADNHILPGIARKHLIQACMALEIPVVEKLFTLDELKDADEVIVSSSSTLCLPIQSIDGLPVGGKDEELLDKLRSYVMQECDTYIAEHRAQRVTISSAVRKKKELISRKQQLKVFN